MAPVVGERRSVTIKELDGDVAKLVVGAARRRVLVYTLVSGAQYVGRDDLRVKTVYINMDDLKRDSVFMSFANEHLPSGTGQISAVCKKDRETWGYPYRWYTQVNDSPVDYWVDGEDYDVEEEIPLPSGSVVDPSNIFAMIEELGEVTHYPAPLGFVEHAMAATFVRMCY